MKHSNLFILLILILLAPGCATRSSQNQTDSVLLVGKNSFILGCVTGIKHLTQAKKTYGKNLDFCKDAAIKHKNTLKEILE
jgi:hypothetical protein